MDIYTRTSDNRETPLMNGSRVSKANPRIKAYETINERNAAISVVIPDEGLSTTFSHHGAMAIPSPVRTTDPRSPSNFKGSCVEKPVDPHTFLNTVRSLEEFRIEIDRLPPDETVDEGDEHG